MAIVISQILFYFFSFQFFWFVFSKINKMLSWTYQGKPSIWR